MLQTKLVLFIAGAVLTVLATGCIVSFEPETAVNPIGTDHTVTVSLESPDIDEDEFEQLLCELAQVLFPEEEDICLEQGAELAQIEPANHIQHNFEVISGPNQGQFADDDDIELVARLAFAHDHVTGREVHRVRERCDALQFVVGALREQPTAPQQRGAVGQLQVVRHAGWVTSITCTSK